MTSNSHRLRCPSCGATYLYSLDKINDSSVVECQNCGKRFSTQAGTSGLSAAAFDDADAIKPSIHFLSETVDGVRVRCPICGSKYIYTDEHRLDGGKVSCQNCGSTIDADGENVILVKEPAPARVQTEDWGICVIIIIIILFVPWLIAIPLILCIAAWKMVQPREPSDLDTKIVKRDVEGPGPW
ncbi:MAG: MJ0042-type zinc finger domain-containing protein [Candidatus Thorarchaeota archaeon]